MIAEIDGTDLSDGPRFALSVSDILPADMLEERLAHIADIASGHRRLGFVCVRNDSMDPVLFSSAAVAASGTGLGLILESSDPVCLREAVACLEGRTPLLCITDAGRLAEAALLSCVSGCALAVPGRDTEELMENVGTAQELGADGIVLNPRVTNMKACLETCTDLLRLRAERSFPPACHPVMTRAWSGEYALAVASVSVMRGGSLMVLDDLDEGCCDVLERLMDGFRIA